MKLKYKKLSIDIPDLRRHSSSAAAVDLYSACSDPIAVPYGSVTILGTGVCLEIPDGHCGLIRMRSSWAKSGILLVGSGLIDSDYRGEIKLALSRLWPVPETDEHKILSRSRLAQILILPYWAGEFDLVSELSETERGAGGFGSTGQGISK